MPSLDGRLVRDGCDALRDIVSEGNGPGFPGSGGHALQVLGNALLLGLLRLGVVLLDALQEVLPRAGHADVLDADVDTLLQVAVADLLVAAVVLGSRLQLLRSNVQNDTDGGLCDVVDDTGLSVVDLVGHTLLDGTCSSISPSPASFSSAIPYRWLRHRRYRRPCMS